VVQGLRPTKPEYASSIGFSDVLWSFVQRCWDGDSRLRPKVGEVVTHLGSAVADWDGLMPPGAPVENIIFDPEGPTSDTLPHCKFANFILPWHCLTGQRYRRNLPIVDARSGEPHRITSYLWAIQSFEHYPLCAQRTAAGRIPDGHYPRIRDLPPPQPEIRGASPIPAFQEETEGHQALCQFEVSWVVQAPECTAFSAH